MIVFIQIEIVYTPIYICGILYIMKEDKIYLYGKHALREALMSNARIIKKVFLSPSASENPDVFNLMKEYKITPSITKGSSGKTSEDAVHQGVIAEIAISELYTPFEDVLDLLKKEDNPMVVILDELQDPHNVGAIIRTAVAFGAKAIFLPEHNQAPITGVVIKTSAGMVFRIPIVRIGNVNQTIRKLKDNNFWIYGLLMDGDTSLKDAKFDTPTVVIIGNESEGIRQKTLELCDVKLSIHMTENCESLNASVAASVVLYEYFRNFKK